ncbi:MAG: hypothetical protein WBA51_10790 [Erythrobacter sp.]
MAFDMTSTMMDTANIYVGTSAMRAADKARHDHTGDAASPRKDYVAPTTAYRPDAKIRRDVQD